jgi:hypothetical protein
MIMKTKTLYRFLVTDLLLVFLIACSDDLDKSPTNQFDSATFWTNETNAHIALTAVYRGNISYDFQVEPTDWWSYAGIAFFELMTDNAYDRRGDNSNLNRVTNGTLLPNNPVLLGLWKGSYKKVTIANNFLAHIDDVPMDDTKKLRFKSEVRFLRAVQYFYLSQHFGSVPLVKEVLTAEQANKVTKAPKTEIESFVTTEFNEAIAGLPRYKDIPASEIGRVSKQAALAFLGRLQLAQKKYSDAATTYKQIIDFADNIIDPDYAGLFTPTNENSTENILSTQFIELKAPNYLPQHAYPAIAGGYHFINPYEDLAINYDFIDGTPFSYTDPRFNLSNRAENRDPRFAYTFLWDGCNFGSKIYDCHPDHTTSIDQLTISKQATRTGYGLRKYFDETFSGDLATGYGGNMPIIRYAEVLLSYLEAKLEAGDPVSQSLLDETINKVRGRASVNMPVITETNAGALRPVLRKERRIELAMEGVRLWDILRWGIAGDVLAGDFWGATFPDSNGSLNLPKDYPKDTNSRWWVTKKNFRVGQDEVWPIPESETNINPGLKE